MFTRLIILIKKKIARVSNVYGILECQHKFDFDCLEEWLK